MSKACLLSFNKEHQFKKIGVSKVCDRADKCETLYTYHECINCGHRIVTIEPFGVGVVIDMWIAREYGRLPYASHNIEYVANGGQISPIELNRE